MSKRLEDNTSGASEKRVMKVENNNWIPLFSRKSLWVFLCVAGFFGGGMSCQLQAASDSPAIADWVERQVWFVNLAGSMPRGVGLLILPETEEKESGWESFSLRETHSENSGFDPSVSPLVGIFRVSPDRGMIEWMDPVSGDWQSIAAFLRSRSADDTKSADGEPASMPGKQSTSDDSTDNHQKSHPRELRGDLDGDGHEERVRWEPIDSADGDTYFSLVVVDHEEHVLWTGPMEKSLENSYVYFKSHFGSSLPQLLMDIDNDGQMELLAPEPQSDVSVTFFRRLRWKNEAFRALASSALLWKDETKPVLTWQDEEASYGTWVSKFGSVTEDGQVQAAITRYLENGEWRGGIALLRFSPTGATIEKWIHPLSENPPPMTSSDEPSVKEVAVVDTTRFPLEGSIALAYSAKAFTRLRTAGTKLTANLTIDEYGPLYVEEEAIAFVDLSFTPGESVRFGSRWNSLFDPRQNHRRESAKGSRSRSG